MAHLDKRSKKIVDEVMDQQLAMLSKKFDDFFLKCRKILKLDEPQKKEK